MKYYRENKMSNVVEMLEKALHSSPLFLLPLLSFLLLYKCVLTSSSKARNLPPSPPKLPILGHLHQLGMHPHRSLRSLSEQYGDLMLMYFGGRPTVVISSAKVAKEIMKTHDVIFSDRPKFSINDKLLYNSREVSAAPYGEYWRQLKSICVLQLLSNKRVRSFRDIREEETALLMEKIQRSGNKKAVNLSEMFVVLTNDVVCRVAFGRKYSGNKLSCGVDFKEVLTEFVELLGVFNVGDFVPWLAWVNRFNGLNGRLDSVAKRFDAILEEILAEHLDKLNQTAGEDSDIDNKNKAKDFIDVLLQVQKENSIGFSLEIDSIKGLILDVFAAGTDTTRTVLEWAMAELFRNPRVMAELQKEVRGVAGDKEQVTEEDLEKMKYLKAVIKETLRLHPPVPLLVPRESTQDVNINGYHIPARTLVIVNAWAIQREPVTWEEPEEFCPERFMCSSIDFKGTGFELIPFGGGRRICPGISFTIANNELALANLMHRFDWMLPAGVTGDTLDMSECTGLTKHKKTPLLAVATPHVHQ